MLSREELRAALQDRGLSQVWLPAEQIGPETVNRLEGDLLQIDWELFDRQRKALRRSKERTLPVITPPTLVNPSKKDGSLEQSAAREMGEAALREGGVAILTVAGGQASRLGFEGPKGAFPLGNISGASLFQIMAGQIRRMREVYACNLLWIIQTGPGNHEETKAFFEKRNHFGLGAASMRFVCQGTLPALSPKGQLLLTAPDKLFRNPDGHGGVYRAMKMSGTLAELRKLQVHTLFYCQVDNPLAWIGDPVFIGHHLQQEARMSVKVVEKTNPTEKVGLVVADGDRNTCVEYSDLAEEIQAERAADGGLKYRAGNIAIHAFSLDFMEEMAEANLPLHLARKEIYCLSSDGVTLAPRDGVKFESFVFDALPLARKSVVQLALREEEFAPVKNREGVDSIQTSRESLTARSKDWIEIAQIGAPFTLSSKVVEIESGLCLGPADLTSRKQSLEWFCNNQILGLKRRVDG
ncbi:MAG: UTP--glucose-1-phosphate uridylyltransferase [Planctomycetota bacterium]|nr:UTP--glucose-1-phosphate uridylyltransferase [Planctomycetota bacterium]MDA1114148.1 UTP--glucose-1-phosphate uridylyltransferase [Planctomycetota bacterium]